MRSRALPADPAPRHPALRRVALALVASTLAVGCGARGRGWFTAPAADPLPREDGVRVVSAPRIREVSAAGIEPGLARGLADLPAPHRGTSPHLAPHPPRTPAELRALVGQRDKRDSITAALAWARDLGTTFAGRTTVESAEDLIAWAERHERLAGALYPAAAGDLLVFDHATGDEASDLIAIAIDRDARGVTEVLYLGGGIVRRGFVDATRPRVHRDRTGATVNTYVRHGKRWPPKGTRYLAGELLAHVIRVR